MLTEDANPLGRLVAKALTDEVLRAQLIADPAAALAAEGVRFPEHVTVKVLEDTENVRHLVLPALSNALTEEDLGAIAAGRSPTPTPRPSPTALPG
jgi:hypothetical protein